MPVSSGILTIESQISPANYVFSLLNSVPLITNPTIVQPVAGQFCAVGVPFVFTVTVPTGTAAATAQFGAQAPVAMSIIGTTATVTITPAGGDVSVTAPLSVTAGTGSAAITVDVEANLAFWQDAANPNSYTASGTNLTSLKSLISGSSLTGITGAPQFNTDPRDGKPAFIFPDNGGGDYVKGVDATYQSAATGTDKAFTSVVVTSSSDVTFNAATHSASNTGGTTNSQEFFQTGGQYAVERDGSASRTAASEGVQAGLSVIVQHSSDGLTVKTIVAGSNGIGAESSATILSAGALAPNNVGVGVVADSLNLYPYYGYIREILYFSADKTSGQISAIINAMLKKWKPPPVVYFLGDSITTAQLATNGGFPSLLPPAIAALGGTLDPEGPLSVGQVFPFKHSAISGDTCAQMNTRVNSATQGLGKGGGSNGYYQRTQLVCLFAGTNGFNTTDYTTLLNSIYTKLIQGAPSGKIAVTTITDINGSTASVTAFNAALPAIWATFEAAHPGVLIKWDAYQAMGAYNATYYVDNIHPNNAGYVRLMTDPTYGLTQAVKSYILSIQPT